MSKISYEKYELHPDQILFRNFHGVISAEDIISSWEYCIANELLKDSHTGVINDIRDATLNMDLEEFEKLIRYLKSNPRFIKIRLAVICDSPEKIIFPILGGMKTNKLNIRPFTTVAAALAWINEAI